MKICLYPEMHQLDSLLTACTPFLLLTSLSLPFRYIHHHFEHVEQVYHNLVINRSSRRIGEDDFGKAVDHRFTRKGIVIPMRI